MRNDSPHLVSRYTRHGVPALLCLILALAGCDTAADTGDGSLTLPPLSNCDGDLETLCDLRFQVNASALSNGSAAITADKSIDLGPYLQDVEMGGGFSESEVQQAEVTDVQLELVSPPGSNLSALESATLSFGGTDVAGLNAGATALTPTGNNVASSVRQGGFQALLTIDVRDPQPDAIYVFIADVEMKLEVAAN